MPRDELTRLEDMMEERYNERRDALVEFSAVPDWSDVCYRAGYLKAIRDIGGMIREIKNPGLPKETGEIPDIFKEGNDNEPV